MAMKATGLSIREGKDAPAMAQRTTLRLGGSVLAEVLLADPSLAGTLPETAARLGGKLACIGAGSNILAGEGPLPLVLVKNAMEPEITVTEETEERVVLRASASVKLPALLARAAGMDVAGLEGLTGIPGTVGGAVAMNAGSYGQCVADALVSMTVATDAGKIQTFARDEICFAYRHMSVSGLAPKAWTMVTAAEFALTRCKKGEASARAKAHMAQKQATQPVTAASAGCVFKNPSPENSAGKLLDQAGFKGKRLGGMAFSSIHANFLVNEGGGTSAQALELLEEAKQAVLAMHGIALAPEVKIWL